MVDKECKVEKAPGAMLEILLSYSDSRRTELRPVKVLLSMQLIWLLRSILKNIENNPLIYLLDPLEHVYNPDLKSAHTQLIHRTASRSLTLTY